jgi:phage major head subunit gpT-like protein
MAFEEFFDWQDDTGKNSFTGWRCLICGKVLDPLIDAHRRNRTPVPVIVSKARRKLVSKTG